MCKDHPGCRSALSASPPRPGGPVRLLVELLATLTQSPSMVGTIFTCISLSLYIYIYIYIYVYVCIFVYSYVSTRPPPSLRGRQAHPNWQRFVHSGPAQRCRDALFRPWQLLSGVPPQTSVTSIRNTSGHRHFCVCATCADSSKFHICNTSAACPSSLPPRRIAGGGGQHAARTQQKKREATW